MKFVQTLRIWIVTLLIAAVMAPVGGFAQDEPNQEYDSRSQRQLTPEEMRTRADMVRAIRDNIGLFGNIYRQISARYVDPINPEAFMKAGIDGMLATLDPYTEYMEPENAGDLAIMSKGKYGGVGLQIGTRGTDRVLTVISPIEGTPAWRLGIRAGDQILTIDGESTQGFTTSDAADRLRGEPNTPVKITVHRFGVDEPLEYTIVREEIKVNDVSYAGYIADGIGYVRLTRFSRSAGDEVRSAILDLESQGELKGLVFDLRSNPGGLLPEAIAVAENFLQPGDLIVSTRGRTPDTFNEYAAEAEPSLPKDVPLIVMINEGSASASEIVSGAIQDHDRGLIVGRTSFGKGLVQSVVPFTDGTALRMTTAKYYTPSGRLIQKVDYFSDNKSIIAPVDSVTEDSVYYTTGGRKVRAHGGITPDVDIQMPEVGELTLALWRQDRFYDFANVYLNQHPDMDSWEVGPKVFDEFRTYLDTSKFDYQSDIEHRIEQLRAEADSTGYGKSFLKEVADLDSMAQTMKEQQYVDERQEIEQRIRLEFASAIAGNAGRVKASLDIDPQVQKAIEIFTTKNEYTTSLSATPGSQVEQE